MATKPAQWAIYARQSLDRTGAGLAVERQIEDCRKLGKRLKLTGQPTVYTDNDVSASSGRPRPDYERLMTALRSGQHAAVVVWHTDRLHRRPIELEEYISVSEARRVITHTVQRGPLDLSTADGQLQARIAGAVARHEVQHKAARRSRAALQKAEHGGRNGGGRSFGYGRTEVMPDGGRRDYDIEKLNRREAAAIRLAFNAILRGESTTSIWKAWNKRGLLTPFGNRWTGSTFRNMVKRPSLAGLVTYKGEVLEAVEASWPAIVSIEKWRTVQSIINDPARRTSPGNQPRHLCSGIVYCGCGLPLRAGTNSIKSKQTGKARAYIVYRCSAEQAGHSTILKEVLDERVRQETIHALWLGKGKPEGPRSEDDKATLIGLNTDLANAHAGLQRLADAIADDVITADDARARSAKLRADVERLTRQIAEVTHHAAAVGVEDATWEALWQGIDVSLPLASRNEHGTQTFHAGRALLQSMMRSGMTEDEAKAKAHLGGRFDDLSLDQQRALVKAQVLIKVRATGRGSRPADRVDVVRL